MRTNCFLLLFLYLLALSQATGDGNNCKNISMAYQSLPMSGKVEKGESSEKLKGEKGGKLVWANEKGDKKTVEKGDAKGEKGLKKKKDDEKGKEKKEKKVEKLPLKIVDNPVTPRGTGYD